MNRRALVVLGLMGAAALAGPLATQAAAHPLGNFTTNTSAGLHLSPDGIRLDYVVDLAEIPTVRARQDMDADHDDAVTAAERGTWARQRCGDLAPLLRVRLDTALRRPTPRASSVSFADGEAGLPTTRLECSLGLDADIRAIDRVAFRDAAFSDRIGWREVVAEADGIAIVERDVPVVSPSRRLRAYPPDRMAAPLDQRTAALRLGGPTVAGQLAGSVGVPDAVVGRVDRVTTTFTALVARPNVTVGFALLAVAVATALGALHALAPGHGKTVMAAYLVGERGGRRHALALGGTVAVTHTLGVMLLGLALSTSQVLAPERLYPWLGATSGLLFSAVGVLLVRRALLATPHDAALDTTPAPGAAHGHVHASTIQAAAPVTWRTVALPGLAGGLLPSPSALLVLLGGVALGRAWFGILLVIAYGAGMATTLVGAGFLLLRARSVVERRALPGRWDRLAWFTQRLPLVAAALVVAGGVVITARSLLAA